MFESGERSILEILEAIQVPDSKYDAANRSFISICEWLARDESDIARYRPATSLQGSFKLGTAIRPITDDDDYDVDIVCILEALTKTDLSPAKLKQHIGREIKAYCKSHGMAPPHDGRRCWTQSYADGSQFHVDTLPALPDPTRQRVLLEDRGLSAAWVESAIAITDQTDANYEVVSDRWPLSNPAGFAAWFESRMLPVLRKRKEAIALAESAKVDDIPTYRAKVPLQSAIQLLKYHRDMMFADDSENKPISVIITTLAAQAYQNETTVIDALDRVIVDLHLYIEQEHGIDWIRNPTNGLENFADKWIEHPKRRDNFYSWLRTLRNDFERLKGAVDSSTRKGLIEESFGVEVAKRIADGQPSVLRKLWDQTKLRLLSNAPHRKAPPWDGNIEGTVRIYRAIWTRNGFRPNAFR